MGLFSRKPKNKAPDVSLRTELQSELAAVKERLAASEQARSELDALKERLAASEQAKADLDARLDSRLGALDRGVALMGDQVTALSSSNARLDQTLTTVDDLDRRLRELVDRLNTPISAPPPSPSASPPPPPPTAVGVDEERLDDLALRLDALATAVAAHTDRMSSADTRVTSVSTELANQLTELSRDIDDLNRRTAEQTGGENEVISADTAEIEARLTQRLDAAIDDVLDTTEKLAAEQARYEIQFRADLAELAERLRRPNAS